MYVYVCSLPSRAGTRIQKICTLNNDVGRLSTALITPIRSAIASHHKSKVYSVRWFGEVSKSGTTGEIATYYFFICIISKCQMYVDYMSSCQSVFWIYNFRLCIVCVYNMRFNIPKTEKVIAPVVCVVLCVILLSRHASSWRLWVLIFSLLKNRFIIAWNAIFRLFYCKCYYIYCIIIFFLRNESTINSAKMNQTMEGHNSNDKQTESNTRHNHNERYGIICIMWVTLKINILCFSRKKIN